MKRLLFILLFIYPIFIFGQENIDTLNVNFYFNKQPIVKNGVILNNKLNFFNFDSGFEQKGVIKKDIKDSTFIKINFKNDYDVVIGFSNKKKYEVFIDKSNIRLSYSWNPIILTKNILGFIKLKNKCRPYSMNIINGNGTTVSILYNSKCANVSNVLVVN